MSTGKLQKHRNIKPWATLAFRVMENDNHKGTVWPVYAYSSQPNLFSHFC